VKLSLELDYDELDALRCFVADSLTWHVKMHDECLPDEDCLCGGVIREHETWLDRIWAWMDTLEDLGR